jgi:uncharacterized membrane protein YjdF
MDLLAATTSGIPAFTVVREIPVAFWLRLALAVALVVGAVVFTRKLARTNPVVLGVVVFVAVTMIGFSWIYERDEPAWATPAVQWLAGYFPTKAN